MTALAVTRGSGTARDGHVWFKARAAKMLDWLVAFWIFTGSMVITEPSPYELTFVVTLGVALFAGLGIYRSTLALLVLLVAFVPFALIGAFQPKYMDASNALIFVAVTIFLLFTAYFVANYVAEAPQKRMRLIMNAYLATAVIAAIIGTLGYLDLIPGREFLTRNDRAKAFFNDPNVFGPFLILPAMFALQRFFLGTRRAAIWAGIFFLILFIGVFASFSRAAWGHFAASSVLVYLLCFFLVAHAKEKVRMLLSAMTGVLLLGVALGGLLSIPAVGRLFEVRASSQNYDEGETGRFGRQGFAFELALANPLGIGPLEFRNLRVVEEPHDSYVNVLHVYGWAGGLAFYLLIGTTIWRGISYLARPSPNRLLLLPLVATFIPLCVEAAIIDLDHWRHFYLVAGLIWGVTAAYRKTGPGEDDRLSALI